MTASPSRGQFVSRSLALVSVALKYQIFNTNTTIFNTVCIKSCNVTWSVFPENLFLERKFSEKEEKISKKIRNPKEFGAEKGQLAPLFCIHSIDRGFEGYSTVLQWYGPVLTLYCLLILSPQHVLLPLARRWNFVRPGVVICPCSLSAYSGMSPITVINRSRHPWARVVTIHPFDFSIFLPFSGRFSRHFEFGVAVSTRWHSAVHSLTTWTISDRIVDAVT